MVIQNGVFSPQGFDIRRGCNFFQAEAEVGGGKCRIDVSRINRFWEEFIESLQNMSLIRAISDEHSLL